MTYKFAPEVVLCLAERFIREAGTDPGQTALLLESEVVVGVFWACRDGVYVQAQEEMLARFHRFAQEQRKANSFLIEFVSSFAYELGELVMIRTEDGEIETVKGAIVSLYISVPGKPHDVDLATIADLVGDYSGLSGDGVPGLYAASARVFQLTIDGFAASSHLH